MGKSANKKTGKGRLDKYYHLAKDQGYRSRAAFKLVQLNKKFDFLSNSKAVLDLCAAPGGWCQVAAKFCPVSSLIIGIDLVPIKPIKNVITLTEDITTPKCRKEIQKQLKTWKVDTVLNDGAPNMGSNWVQDAFTQAELVLHSLKLATEFLREGGNFVTKVFRSQDYNNLLWVFGQLFKRVHATKPSASRSVSAEIFVVCQGFLAPTTIDPRMLDPKHVFTQVELAKKTDVFTEKGKRNRGGYADDAGNLLYAETTLANFVDSDSPITVLSANNKLIWDDGKSQEYLHMKSKVSIDEVKECIRDLKVLGKNDFRLLLKWRLGILSALDACKEKSEAPEVEEKPEDSEDEDTRVGEELLSIQDKLKRKKKKLLKKRREEMAKYQRRVDLKHVLPEDQIDLLDEVGLFRLGNIKSKEALDKIAKGSEPDMRDVNVHANADNLEVYVPGLEDGGLVDDVHMYDDVQTDTKVSDDWNDFDSSVSSDSGAMEEALESQLDHMYAEFKAKKATVTTRERVGRHQKMQRAADVDVQTLYDKKIREKYGEGSVPVPRVTGEMFSSASDEDNHEGPANPLLVSSEEIPRAKRAAMWFDNPQFQGIDTEEDDEAEIARMAAQYRAEQARGKKRKRPNDASEEQRPKRSKQDAQPDAEEVQKTEIATFSSSGSDDGGADERNLQFEEVPVETHHAEDHVETMAIARQIADRRRREELVDDSYNRRAFNDDTVPSWFLDDEKKHNQVKLPYTKADIQELKEMYKEINARPIKKIAEARARKKKKAMIKSAKAKAKADAVVKLDELDNKSKMKALEKIYSKLDKNARPSKSYIVAKKGKTGGGGKSTGSKYKMVDSRMKSDTHKSKKRMKDRKGRKQKPKK